MREKLHPEQQRCLHEISNILQPKLGQRDILVTELARKVRMDKAYISSILSGTQTPSRSALAGIVEVLGMTFEEHVLLEALAGRVHPLIPPDLRIRMAKEIAKNQPGSLKANFHSEGVSNWDTWTP